MNGLETIEEPPIPAMHMGEFKILLFEDEADWQEILTEKLQRALKQLGNPDSTIEVEGSFEKAYRKLSNSNWNLLVADIVYEKEGRPKERLGMELIELASSRKIPAIAVSGSVSVTGQDVCRILMKYGALYFFSKQNFEYREFFDIVKQQLAKTRRGLTLPINILFFAANPIDTQRLRIDREIRDVQDILRSGELEEHYRIETRSAVRPSDISTAIMDIKPTIIHFSGHGRENGELLFEDENGTTQSISADNLAGFFERIQPQLQIQCVILNICHSATLASKLSQHIPYVIGMGTTITDAAAIAFSTGFYKALAASHSIEDAYNLGCGEIQLRNLPEELIPQLLPSGVRE